VQNLTEIRWHGRGGQGVKTAAILTAKSAASSGKYIQGFPEYGPERMGAPVLAFTRISDQEITIHSHVRAPEIVVVLDPSLIESVDITEGVPEDGVIIINTDKSPEEMREYLDIEGRKIYTVDAALISTESIGRNIPNTTMMGALIRVTGIIDWEDFKNDMKNEFRAKFTGRDEIIEGNMEAIKRAYQEVEGE